jgi:hypothetical protein
MWFEKIASSDNPGIGELIEFTHGVEGCLGFVLEQRQEFAFLWEEEPELWGLAQDTFKSDVQPAAARMRDVIGEIPESELDEHGLRKKPLKFKLRVLNSIANRWRRIQEQFKAGTLRRMLAAREWFKKVVEAIDAVLDSFIEAAGGAGGLIKEFKDALGALA